MLGVLESFERILEHMRGCRLVVIRNFRMAVVL